MRDGALALSWDRPRHWTMSSDLPTAPSLPVALEAPPGRAAPPLKSGL